MSYGTIFRDTKLLSMSKEQKNRLLKAKIAVALHDELGRASTQKEIEQVFLMAKVMYKAASYAVHTSTKLVGKTPVRVKLVSKEVGTRA